MKKLLLSFIVFCITGSVVFAQGGVDKPIYQIETHRAGSYLGTFNVELFPLIAPMHVQNFDSLVNDQFFDSTAFHRVVPGFVIQGGDPNSISGPISTWGQGQPWQVTVPAEFNVVRHLRGILGAARDSDPNSANSQFYICVANATFLDGNYTVYGKVVNGMEVVDTIVASPRDANDVPLQKIEMFVTYVGVNDSVPAAPVLNLPIDGAQGVLNTQNFSWNTVNSAVMYTIEFSTDSLFSTIDITKNAGTNFILVTEIAGSTQYYWRVRSNNGGHESANSNVHVFNSATAAPILTFPPDSATSVNVNPIFTWDPVPGADSYTLQVSTSATFTTQSMVFNTAGLTATSQQVTLNPNTLYYWRVRSASGTTQGFYSVKFSFTTGTTIGLNETSESIRITAVYPNPASEFITVAAFLPYPGLAAISMTNILGQKVYDSEKEITGTELRMEIPVAHIASGIYQLQLKMGDVFVTRKVAIH